MGFWFRQQYRIPPTDPRYLEMSQEDLLLEYWSYRYHKDPDLDSKEMTNDGYEDALAEIEAGGGDWEPLV